MVPFVSSGEEKKPAHALVLQATGNPSGAFCRIKWLEERDPGNINNETRSSFWQPKSLIFSAFFTLFPPDYQQSSVGGYSTLLIPEGSLD